LEIVQGGPILKIPNTKRAGGVAQVVFFFFFFPVLGFELRAFALSHSTSPFFVKGFFKIGCRELFAHAVFEPLS
jgi:hypothetical protein